MAVFLVVLLGPFCTHTADHNTAFVSFIMPPQGHATFLDEYDGNMCGEEILGLGGVPCHG